MFDLFVYDIPRHFSSTWGDTVILIALYWYIVNDNLNLHLAELCLVPNIFTACAESHKLVSGLLKHVTFNVVFTAVSPNCVQLISSITHYCVYSMYLVYVLTYAVFMLAELWWKPPYFVFPACCIQSLTNALTVSIVFVIRQMYWCQNNKIILREHC